MKEGKSIKLMEMYNNQDITFEWVIEDNVGRVELHIIGQRPQTVVMFGFDFIPTEQSQQSYLEDMVEELSADLYDYIKHGNLLREVE